MLSYLLYSRRNCGTEKAKILPKVTQLFNSEARIHTQAAWVQCSCPEPAFCLSEFRWCSCTHTHSAPLSRLLECRTDQIHLCQVDPHQRFLKAVTSDYQLPRAITVTGDRRQNKSPQSEVQGTESRAVALLAGTLGTDLSFTDQVPKKGSRKGPVPAWRPKQHSKALYKGLCPSGRVERALIRSKRPPRSADTRLPKLQSTATTSGMTGARKISLQKFVAVFPFIPKLSDT